MDRNTLILTYRSAFTRTSAPSESYVYNPEGMLMRQSAEPTFDINMEFKTLGAGNWGHDSDSDDDDNDNVGDNNVSDDKNDETTVPDSDGSDVFTAGSILSNLERTPYNAESIQKGSLLFNISNPDSTERDTSSFQDNSILSRLSREENILGKGDNTVLGIISDKRDCSACTYAKRLENENRTILNNKTIGNIELK
jgi:hypothetical protein